MDVGRLEDMCSAIDEASKLEEDANALYQQAISMFERAKRLRGEQSRKWQSMIDARRQGGAP